MSKNGVPPKQQRNFPEMFKDIVFDLVGEYNLDRELAENLAQLMRNPEPVFF